MNVSVVIPNYNGERYILDCIASIYDQIKNKEEIIVIDNNSSDNSVAIISKRYSDITLIENELNLGFASAVNQGIKHSNSEFVILLNNDAFAEPDFVYELYNCINKDPLIFSVSSKMLSYANPEQIDNAGDQLCLTGWAFKTGDGKSSSLFNKERVTFSACAGAAIYRKQTFERIGYFDETFFAYLEDVDVGFRANVFGYKNVFCPSAKVLHIGSATTGSNKYNDFKVKTSARNNVYLLFKNIPVQYVVFLMPFFVIGFSIKTLFFLRIGYGRQYVGGLIKGFKTFSSIEKTKIPKPNIRHYLRISYMMLKSTAYYFGDRISRIWKRTNNKAS